VSAPAIALLLVSGCSSSKDDGSSATTTEKTSSSSSDGTKYVDLTAQPKVVVKAVDNNFEQQFIEVKKGTTVTFQNDGRNRHDVVPDEENAFPEIATDQFDPGTSADVTFDQPGVIGYYCSLHGTPTKGMYGKIKVVG
jgi:plastocyanin